MPEKKHNDLLGYVLGALSESELEAVETQLGDDPVLARRCLRLRRRLARLHLDQLEYDPPAGLARRTCQAVALAGSPCKLPDAPSVASQRRRASASAAGGAKSAHTLGNITSEQAWEPLRAAVDLHLWLNALVSATVVLVAALVVFSALGISREDARSLACEEHLHRVGIGLLQYGAFQQDDLPEPLRVRPHELAGVGPGRLLTVGLVDDDRWQQIAGTPLGWELRRCGEHPDEGILLVLHPATEEEPPAEGVGQRNTRTMHSAVAGLGGVFASWFAQDTPIRNEPVASVPAVTNTLIGQPRSAMPLKALLPDGRVAPYLLPVANSPAGSRGPIWFTSPATRAPGWTPAAHRAGRFVPIVPVSQR